MFNRIVMELSPDELVHLTNDELFAAHFFMSLTLRKHNDALYSHMFHLIEHEYQRRVDMDDSFRIIESTLTRRSTLLSAVKAMKENDD